MESERVEGVRKTLQKKKNWALIPFLERSSDKRSSDRHKNIDVKIKRGMSHRLAQFEFNIYQAPLFPNRANGEWIKVFKGGGNAMLMLKENRLLFNLSSLNMMKSIIFATTFYIVAVSAMQAFEIPKPYTPPGPSSPMQTFEIPHPYIPPGPDDYRSPCPALNILANHGYLPHNGSYWKAVDVIPALIEVYNIEPSLSSILAWGGVFLVGNTLTQSFSLGDFSGWQEMAEGVGVSRHNRIEHDASLTRLDAYFGDNHSFDPELYQQLKDVADKLNGSDFNTEVMSVHRYNRYQDSKANNPSFTFGTWQQALAYTEAAVALLGLGGQNGTAAAATFDSFFIHEKIPGNYTKSPVPVDGTRIGQVAREIFNKNPVPIQGIDFLKEAQDFECFYVKTIHTMLPDIASSLISFVTKNTGISLSANCASP